MRDYGKMLDFYLRNQEAERLAFETAKQFPFLFILAPAPNPPVEPWQPLLFGSFPENPRIADTPVVLPDVPGTGDSAS